MKIRYYFFTIISMIIVLFSWYYLVCFCGIYYSMSMTLMLDNIMSIFLDYFVIQIIISLIVSIIWFKAKFIGTMM